MPDNEQLRQLPILDEGSPEQERFPRLLVIGFAETARANGRPTAAMRLLKAEPNAFPEGPVSGENGKLRGFAAGAQLGDPLTDNNRTDDAYRYHDAIHLGFMAVLGWSPNTRSLLRIKRKSDPAIDECEDGARAIFAEEGLAAVLSRLAKRRMGFLEETCVDGEVIGVARAAAAGLEAEKLPGWIWRRAICQGFRAMRRLADNRGGKLIANLDSRSLIYSKL